MGCVMAMSLGSPSITSAQRPRVATVAQRAVFESVAERWLYAGLKAQHTPFATGQRWRFLDSVRVLPGGERIIFSTYGSPASGNRMQLTVGGNGLVSGSVFTPRTVTYTPSSMQGENSFSDRVRRRWTEGSMLQLPDAVPFADMSWRGAIVRGRSVSDSIHEVTELLGMRAILDGHRTRTVDRDTVVDGRRLWFVRERSTVRYAERLINRERTLDTLVTLNRGGSGTLVEWALIDADSGLVRWRADSLRIEGKASWRYADGRVFTTPLRMERWRDLRYMSARNYDVMDSMRIAVAMRQQRGMVRFLDSTGARLFRDAPGVRDSVERAWRSATSAEEAERLWRELWQAADKPWKRRLAAMRAATGDTVFALAQDAAIDWESPIDSLQMKRRIAVMADPGSAVRVGVQVDPFYEDIAQRLATQPPASTPDTARWPCTPAASRLLAAQYASAREPRLRAVALVAHVVLDPKGWGDSLLRQPDQPLLTEANWLARGIGATWPAASHAPIPQTGATALDWLEWMNGVAPAYAESIRQFGRDPSLQARLRFEPSHAQAIRFFSVRTGRDVTAELRQRYQSAVGDTARTIFGYLVSQLTGLGMSAEEIAKSLRSGSAADRVLATQEVGQLIGRLRGRMTPVDSATRERLYDAYLAAQRHEGAAPWPMLDAKGTSTSMPEMRLGDSTRFVLVDSVPASVVARWADSAHFITRAQWDARGNRRGGSLSTITIGGALGPFVVVRIGVSGRTSRKDDETPSGWAGGSSFVLLEVDGRWVVVTGDNWIT
jgi:hypothetical protein